MLYYVKLFNYLTLLNYVGNDLNISQHKCHKVC